MVAGNIADLSIGIQSTAGTAAATPLARCYLMGGGFGPMRDVADVEETSASRLRNTAYVQNVRAEGSPQFAVRPGFIPVLLYGAMGTKAVSGAGDPYTHTITLAATQPYLTFWRTLGTLFERFIDVKVASLNFESTAGGVLAVTAELLGLSPSFQSTANTTATPETTNTFVHADLNGQFLVETVAVSRIRRVAVNIATGAQIAYGDKVTGDAVEEGMQEITIETEQVISNFADWNRYHYGTATPANNAVPIQDPVELAGTGVDVKWSKRNSAGAVATPERSLQFTATRLQIAAIEGQDPNTNGDPLARTVRYKVYQPSSGSGLTAIVKNATASYAAS
jgi:hypothetical protein